MTQPDTYRYSDILSLLSTRAANVSGSNALEAPDRPPVSYGTLFEEVTKIGEQLRAAGVSRTSRVALVFPNGPDMATALLGVSCAAIAAPLNPVNRYEEFVSYFSDIKVTFLLLLKGFESPARLAAHDQGLHILEWERENQILISGKEGDRVQEGTQLPSPSVEYSRPTPEDTALILLTSGSTGRSKKVPLTHNNLCASVRDICASLRLNHEDRCLSMWEQFHIGGLVDLLLAPLAAGGTVICAGGFNASQFFHFVQEQKPTWFQGVPATLHELVVHGKRTNWSGERSSLRFIRSVAAALPSRLQDDLEALFQVPVIQTFGMTEAGPLITTNPLPPRKQKRGSVGTECGPEVAIMDEQGHPRGTWELGEIAVRGANIFSGYEESPEDNSRSFRQGWFYTGDMGLIDHEGYLFLKGRVKEMINRGGEKITFQELDDVLLQHADVVQAAAFGMTHPTLGEEVGAALVVKDSSSLTEASIQEYVSERLSEFKVPRRVVFLDELPKTPVGKIDRLRLSGMAEDRPTQTAYVAPRNDLEKFLVKVWEEELAVDQIGIDDNFIDLGGDSLSSVRLISAIELLLQRPLPEKGLSQILTVRQMAQLMRDHGCDQLPQISNATSRLKEGFLDSEIQSIQSLVSLGNGSGADQSTNARKNLMACQTIHQFRALNESFLKYLTPAEALSLANQRVANHVWDVCTPLFWKKKLWQYDIRREIQQGTPSLSWTRKELIESANLFSSGPEPDPNKTLIVGFAGNHLRLMMPHFRFLMHLKEQMFDVLFLWDPKRKHFERGLRGLGNDLPSLNKGLGRIIAQFGYTRVIGLGTSAGALAAISASLTNEWNRSVAVGPDLLIKHPVIEQSIQRSLVQGHPSTEVRIYYAGGRKRDCSSVDQLVSVVPSAQRTPFESYTDHNVLNTAFKEGKLREVFEVFFDL